jgi:hypothetical protein
MLSGSSSLAVSSDAPHIGHMDQRQGDLLLFTSNLPTLDSTYVPKPEAFGFIGLPKLSKLDVEQAAMHDKT